MATITTSPALLVGLVAAYCNASDRRLAFVTSVSVLPDWSGQGLASRLIKDCICHINANGPGAATITGANRGQLGARRNDNMYQNEHNELFASIRNLRGHTIILVLSIGVKETTRRPFLLMKKQLDLIPMMLGFTMTRAMYSTNWGVMKEPLRHMSRLAKTSVAPSSLKERRFL